MLVISPIKPCCKMVLVQGMHMLATCVLSPYKVANDSLISIEGYSLGIFV